MNRLSISVIYTEPAEPFLSSDSCMILLDNL